MPRQHAIAAALGTLAVFTLFVLPFKDWVPDDAFISFEYARNLAEGNGLVFNSGERVEGFSNLLWTLLLAGVHRAGGPIDALAPLLSLAAALVALAWLVAFARRIFVNAFPGAQAAWVTTGVCLLAGVFFPFAFYASSGLETSFYLLCLIAGADLHLRGVEKRSAMLCGLSTLSLLAAALSRPEGIGFLAVSSAFLVARTRRSGPVVLPIVLAALAAYAVVFTWKYAYFGSWVPNTYFAKPGATWSYLQPIARGGEYLTLFFGRSGTIALLPFALYYRRGSGAGYAWRYLWSFTAWQLAFIVFVGGDVLRFDRFAVPLFAWLLVLSGLGALGMLQAAPSWRRPLLTGLLVSSAAFFAVFNVGRAVIAHGKPCHHDWMNAKAQREIGLMLRERMPAASELATNEIGAVKYYSQLTVVDLLGLTDETISAIRYHSFRTYGVGSSAWSAVSVANYVFGRNPEGMLLPAEGEIGAGPGRSPRHPLWRAIRTAPEFARYRAVLGIRIHETKYLYLFLRRDLAPADRRAVGAPHPCLEVWDIGGP